MKKRDNVEVIFNNIMSDENYIDVILSKIKDVRTSIDLYMAIADIDMSIKVFDDTTKLRKILEEADAIVTAIQSS